MTGRLQKNEWFEFFKISFKNQVALQKKSSRSYRGSFPAQQYILQKWVTCLLFPFY
jgi:hypothetical protein